MMMPNISIGLMPDCPVIEAAMAVVSHTPTIVRREETRVISVKVVRKRAMAAKTKGIQRSVFFRDPFPLLLTGR
jgi:hypothetical protein